MDVVPPDIVKPRIGVNVLKGPSGLDSKSATRRPPLAIRPHRMTTQQRWSLDAASLLKLRWDQNLRKSYTRPAIALRPA